jgi:hypothetical protein
MREIRPSGLTRERAPSLDPLYSTARRVVVARAVAGLTSLTFLNRKVHTTPSNTSTTTRTRTIEERETSDLSPKHAVTDSDWELYTDPERKATMVKEMGRVIKLLGGKGAGQRAAQTVLRELDPISGAGS